MISNPLNSRFSYAGAKLIGEVMTINFLKNTKIKFNIFRPHNLFGPDMGHEHVIPDIIKKIIISSRKLKKKDCKIKIQGLWETRQEHFCYIEDAIDQLEVIKRFQKKQKYTTWASQKKLK